jgi:hypothetical protein
MFGIHDFQLYAVTSTVDGNRVIMQVSAVNRGLPATHVALRIYPVVGDGIAELPLAEVTVDSIDTYGEIVLDGEYILPAGEEVEFLAIVDDGDHTIEAFELNNQLRFKAGENISGFEALPVNSGEMLYAYPNPFRDMLWIKYVLEKPASELVFSIYDMKGKIVHKISGMSAGAGFHIMGWTATGLQDGMYFIAVQGRDQDGLSFHSELKVVRK